MSRPILIGYQLLIGFSDAMTGALLIIAPVFALGLMRFVLSVGLACLYGAFVIARRGSPCKLQVVWLLTAITRASVAIFVVGQILAHTLGAGWLSVVLSDGACVMIQAIGLRKGWLAHVAR